MSSDTIRPLARSPTAPAASLSLATLPPPSSSSSSSPSSSVPASPTSSLAARRGARPGHGHSLSLDLSTLPPPLQQQQPAAAPTNTLLLTNLVHPDVFRPDNLQTLRALVEQAAPLHSWAPLRSFRRIVASFFSAADAARVRSLWESELVLGAPVHVYYGRPTPLDVDGVTMQHLALPDAGKLFFISPPPSPPHDWQMRLEGAPNKQVHADDLAEALAKLHHQAADCDDVDMDGSSSPAAAAAAAAAAAPIHTMPSPTTTIRTRSRSSTLVIYNPADHGGCGKNLPAIAVEDLTVAYDDADTADDDANYAAVLPATQPIMAHTQRPPVELMSDA